MARPTSASEFLYAPSRPTLALTREEQDLLADFDRVKGNRQYLNLSNDTIARAVRGKALKERTFCYLLATLTIWKLAPERFRPDDLGFRNGPGPDAISRG